MFIVNVSVLQSGKKLPIQGDVGSDVSSTGRVKSVLFLPQGVFIFRNQRMCVSGRDHLKVERSQN